VTNRIAKPLLGDVLFQAVTAAQEVFTNLEWNGWASTCTTSRKFGRGAAIEAAAVAGAEIDRAPGDDHFAALAAFLAADAVAWAEAGEAEHARQLCEKAIRFAERVGKLA